jgi:hypothetical protein
MKFQNENQGIRALQAAELAQVSGGEIRVYPLGTWFTGYGVRADATMATKATLEAAYAASHPRVSGDIT